MQAQTQDQKYMTEILNLPKVNKKVKNRVPP